MLLPQTTKSISTFQNKNLPPNMAGKTIVLEVHASLRPNTALSLGSPISQHSYPTNNKLTRNSVPLVSQWGPHLPSPLTISGRIASLKQYDSTWLTTQSSLSQTEQTSCNHNRRSATSISFINGWCLFRLLQSSTWCVSLWSPLSRITPPYSGAA